MRNAVLALAIAILCSTASSAQQTAAPAQTARQALMEMFFSKTPGTFVKHLPAATRAALDKAGVLKNLQQYSQMLSQLQAQGQTLQTFDTGSLMLIAENPKTGQKSDITVENDSLNGDQDDIELAFHLYKDGKEQRMPFMRKLTFSMKQEDQVWTLNEIVFTIHVPLADPDLLKMVTDNVKPQSETNGTFVPQPAVSVHSTGSDALVVASMRTILTAELTYATSYPMAGFTCSLSSLDGFGGGEPNEHQAMLINSGLASGKKYGYVFTLSGCSGMPATTFHLVAVPNGNSYGRKAFCADQSAVIRSSDDGNVAACLAGGVPVQP